MSVIPTYQVVGGVQHGIRQEWEQRPCQLIAFGFNLLMLVAAVVLFVVHLGTHDDVLKTIGLAMMLAALFMLCFLGCMRYAEARRSV